jgi:hypothetical protein
MSKTSIVSATVTVPAESPARKLSIAANPITATPNPSTIPSVPAPKPVAVKGKPTRAIRYAAAVLEGQDDMLETAALCFVSNNARIKKQGEDWILESSEFASCTAGAQVFPIADDILSRIHRIRALYCGSTPTFSVEHIYWIDADGKPLREIRSSIPVTVISSKGVADLKSMSGTEPLGSVVFQAMISDPKVKEALSLHGESGLSWSQIYDVIDFLGGVDEIIKAGYATRAKTGPVRQTANHHRHLGSRKNANPLPPNPPTLVEGTEFARNLLKCWIASRVRPQP